MPKLIWLRALSLAAAAAACAHVQARDSAVPLRVLTYNIRAGNGDIARTAETIRRFAPDIVGLQEVDVHWGERSGFEDQATLLGRVLGMQVRFAPIYTLPGADSTRPGRQYGVALLSRHPIVRWTNDTLTRLSTIVSESRAGAGAWSAPGHARDRRSFSAGIQHAPRLSRGSAGRRQQVAEMLAYIGSASTPTLVLGDLNATPDAPELQPLFERLRDTWQNAGDPGLTYPADKPVKRIDYVLASSHFRVRSASVPVTEASDHRPVLVELMLRR